MSSLIETHRNALLSLGFAFQGVSKVAPADPEQTIVDMLGAFYEDRKLYRMLLAWLDATSDLIHMERLNALSKELPPGLRVVLGATALKLLPRDRRWKLIAEAMQESAYAKSSSAVIPDGYADPFLISKNGIDQEFKKLGLKIARITAEDRKKIRSLKAILQSHGWLRIRALIGPNFRADIAYLYLSKRAGGPAEAARLLKCSRDTAYRNWKAVEEADVRSLVRLSA